MAGQATIAETDDDYLKQLEMESADEIDEGSSILESIVPGSVLNDPTLDAPSEDTELILDKKELIVDRASFEHALKATYRESFQLYQELSDEQKNSIYEGFLAEKRLYNASVKIISIYINSH